MDYKGYEINLVCANNVSHDDGSSPVYGDIYDNYYECVEEHPDDEVIYGFFVDDDEAPDWFDDIEDAIDWIDEQISKEENA